MTLLRGLLTACATAFALWLVGFLVFLHKIPTPPSLPVTIDGVSALTGPGGDRIGAGMLLRADGTGDRLLISGVNPANALDRFTGRWPSSNMDGFDCCVDLGHQARTTHGNALETTEWARRHQFKHIVVVTSDYHIPRAMLEMRMQAKDINYYPYPVNSGYTDHKGRPVSFHTLQKLAIEYTKYLAIKGKTFIS